MDTAFNIYIGDTHNQLVRMVTFAAGKISTIAGTGVKGFNGDGLATTAELALPSGVAVGASGIYVADSDNNRIRLISGGQITTIAGNGSEGYSGDSGLSTSAALDTPRAIAVYGGTVVFSDTENQAVREVSAGAVNTLAGASTNSAESFILSGTTTTVFGSGTGTLTATFANGSNTATGPVTLVDGLGASPTTVGTTSLSSNHVSFSTILLTAGTHYLVAMYAGDGNNPAITSGVFVQMVTKASSGAALTTTNTTFILGAPPTLKATVTSTNGSPTGTVNFYDGLTLLNATPVALSGGVAQLTLTTLPVGLGQSLTAVYSGDTNFLTSTSTAVTENVITPDFNITSPTPAQTVLPVSSVNYTITMTPLNPTFVYPVTYSVTSTLPTGVTASFNPTSINAGAGTSSTVLTLTASAQARMDERIHSFGSMAAPSALALLLLPIAFSRRARKTARQLSRSGKAFLGLLMLAGLSALAGCGGGGFFSHPTEYSTVTVTAVCGPDNHATNVTLIIR